MNKLIISSLLALTQKKIPNPELDLRLLLQHASKNNKSIILSNTNIEDINMKYFNSLLEKRLKNQPISKIIKKKYFWKSEFYVDTNVLDPRPETEFIVEQLLNQIKDKNKKLKILDIGTGSGCLAISIAKEYCNSKITAIDISSKALKVAKKNISLHNVSKQIELKLTNFDDIQSKFDVIVSNPPYLTLDDYKNSQIEIRKFEPKIALLGGNDGLKFYKLFSKKIHKIMKNNSILILEIGSNQYAPCLSIFKNSKLKLKKVTKDFQNIDRTLTFIKI